MSDDSRSSGPVGRVSQSGDGHPGQERSRSEEHPGPRRRERGGQRDAGSDQRAAGAAVPAEIQPEQRDLAGTLARVRLLRARTALKRYGWEGSDSDGAGRYALTEECLVTYDPKGPQNQKIRRPWPKNPPELRESLRHDFEDMSSPVEWWHGKSRQTLGSWGSDSFVTASMLTVHGFRAAIQSRNEEASLDFLNRTVYQLRNLRGPLEGVLVEKRDWEKRGHEVMIHRFMGEAMESRLTALPEGAAKWRFIALTLAILDEYSYNTHDKDAYVAALSCVEGGGKLVVIGTSCWGSHMNDEMIVMQDRADVIGEISVPENLLSKVADNSAASWRATDQPSG